MDQGFAAPGVSDAARRVVRGAERVPRSAGNAAVATTEVRRGGEAGIAPLAIQPAGGFLNSVRGAFTSIWTGEFFGAMSGGLLAGAAAKASLPRVQTSVRALTSAPFEALHVPLSKTLHVPAEYMFRVSSHAAGAGGKAIGWSNAAALKSAALERGATQMDTRVAKFFQPMREGAVRLIQRFSGTEAGAKLNSGLQWAAEKRLARVTAHHDASMKAVTQAFTTEAPGVLAGIGNSISSTFRRVFRRPPLAVAEGVGAASEHLAPVLSQFRSAEGLSGAAKISHLEGVMTSLKALMQKPELQGPARKQAGAVMGELTKALSSADAIHRYQGAAGGTLKTLLKTGAQAVGRVPLFSAIVGIGVAAGIGAAVMSSRAESKQAKQAYKELLADIGGDANSPFIHAVQAAYTKQRYGHMAKAGLGMVSNVAEGAFMTMSGGGPMALMVPQMGAQLIATLIPDNPLLNAYKSLKEAEAGRLQLEPAQKQYFIRELIAVMPTVASNGGSYNRLAAAMAEEMIARKMTVSAIVQMLGNDTTFTAFAGEVAQKQKDAKAAEAAAQESAKVESVPDNRPSANDNGHIKISAQPTVAASSAEARYHATERPVHAIAANDAGVEGKLVSTQKMVG